MIHPLLLLPFVFSSHIPIFINLFTRPNYYAHSESLTTSTAIHFSFFFPHAILQHFLDAKYNIDGEVVFEHI